MATTARYARDVPRCYTNQFINMGFPLRYINSFIYLNIINEFSKQKQMELQDIESRMDEPIPLDDLIYMMASMIPKEINQK